MYTKEQREEEVCVCGEQRMDHDRHEGECVVDPCVCKAFIARVAISDIPTSREHAPHECDYWQGYADASDGKRLVDDNLQLKRERDDARTARDNYADAEAKLRIRIDEARTELENIDRMAMAVMGESSYRDSETSLKVACMVQSIAAHEHNTKVDRRRIAVLEAALRACKVFNVKAWSHEAEKEFNADIDAVLRGATTQPETPDLGVQSIVGQLREIIIDQANDPGLWFDADRAPEAYLQRALRDLHGVVERAIAGLSPAQPATAAKCIGCGHVAHRERCTTFGPRWDRGAECGCTMHPVDAAPPSPAARVVVDPDHHVFVADPPPSPVMPSPARETNQCDGCNAGRPVDANGNHHMGDGEYADLMHCQRGKYVISSTHKEAFPRHVHQGQSEGWRLELTKDEAGCILIQDQWRSATGEWQDYGGPVVLTVPILAALDAAREGR